MWSYDSSDLSQNILFTVDSITRINFMVCVIRYNQINIIWYWFILKKSDIEIYLIYTDKSLFQKCINDYNIYLQISIGMKGISE